MNYRTPKQRLEKLIDEIDKEIAAMTETKGEYNAGQRPVDEILDDLINYLFAGGGFYHLINYARELDNALDLDHRPPWLGAILGAQPGREQKAVPIARSLFLKDVERLMLGLGPEVRHDDL